MSDTMKNEYFTFMQAIEFLQCEESILNGHVANLQIRPHFLCSLILFDIVSMAEYAEYIKHREGYLDITGHKDETVIGYLKFKGYVTPSDDTDIPLFDTQKNEYFFVNKVKIIETLRPTKNYFTDGGIEELPVSTINMSKTYQINYNTSDYIKNQGVAFNTKNVFFLESELITLTDRYKSEPIPQEEPEHVEKPLFSSLSIDTSALNDDGYEHFKTAVLAIFKATSCDPQAYPDKGFGNRGVRSIMKNALKNNLETQHLFKNEDHFINFWQKMRKEGILKSTKDLIEK